MKTLLFTIKKGQPFQENRLFRYISVWANQIYVLVYGKQPILYEDIIILQLSTSACAILTNMYMSFPRLRTRELRRTYKTRQRRLAN